MMMKQVMEFLPHFEKVSWDFGARYSHYILSVLLILCALLIHRRFFRPKLNLPPGPIGLPLLGYLPFLGKDASKTLDRLKEKYGNVFGLYLAQTYVVILADYPAVEEAYNTMSMSNRPPRIFDFLPDRLGFASLNGPDWIEQRRFTMRTMRDIGLGKSSWSSLVADELSDFIKLIESKNGQPIDIFVLLTPSISNNICSFLFGKRLPPGHDRDMLNSSLDAIVRFFSHTCLWNFYPNLCLLLTKLHVGKYYAAFKKMVAFNKFMRNEIEIHKKSSNEDDFIGHFLKAMESNEGKGESTNFTEKMMVGTTQTLFVGGSDTTRTTLSWMFMTMALHPEVQQKVYDELQSVLGKEPWATWEDRVKIPYTIAVIMESMRWQSLLPLNTPHWASEDSKVCGYDIPKGTIIISNTWGIHNDPRYWKEPEKFMPDRFLKNGGKEVNYKMESYVPFSIGKRRCPGENIAMMELVLYFTGMTKRFEVQAPKGRRVNMEGEMGITLFPVPQELCFIPRKDAD